MATVPGYTFTISDPRTAADNEVAETVELRNAMREEFFPDEAPAELATTLASIRAIPARLRVWRLAVRDSSGQLVCGASAHKDWEHDDNPDVGGIGAFVRAGHRRKGIGTAVLAWEVAFAAALGQTRLFLSTDGRMPAGEVIAAALGAEVKMREHENRLLTADVDTDLLRGWVAAAPQDYEITALDGSIPEELAQEYVDLLLVMNTAPRDDLDVNDFTYSVKQLREGEAQREQAGVRKWGLVARHRTSGELAGVHDLYFSPDDQAKAYVGVTGVLPAHRGHRLGRVLKAMLTLRLLAEAPEVTCVVTGNADSNAAMLAINEAMGYRPHSAVATWEVSRAHVEQLLRARGVEIPFAEVADAVATRRTGELTTA